MTPTAYPLTWPTNFPRAKSREKGVFKTALAAAIKNVNGSLALFAKDSGKKLENLVISSNVTLGASNPTDPGVAIWFVWDGLSVCVAVDRYQTVEGNLQAIHHIIEARRVELRHGTLALVRASFSGFAALPAPADTHWSKVLGLTLPATLDEAEHAYRRLARSAHPDKSTGNADLMTALNLARDQFRKELQA